MNSSFSNSTFCDPACLGVSLLGVLFLGVVACAGPGASVGAGDEVKASSAKPEAGDAVLKAPPGKTVQDTAGNTVNDRGEVWPLQTQGRSAVTAFAVTPSRDLWVGFEGGVFARINTASPAQVETHRLNPSLASHTIQGFSEDGAFVVLNGDPFTILNIETSEIVLQPNKIGAVQGHTFAPGGTRWFAIDGDSKTHVWEREQLVASKQGEDLRAVIRRSTPKFSAKVGEVTHWVRSPSKDQVLFLDKENNVNLWDIREGRVRGFFSLTSSPVSLSFNRSVISVTTQDQSLRLMNLSKGSFHRWTLQEKANYAALTSEDADRVYTIHNSTLTARHATSGEVVWTRSIPSGTPCGLQAQADNAALALCINRTIVLLNPKDGTLVGGLTAQGQEVSWVSAP